MRIQWLDKLKRIFMTSTCLLLVACHSQPGIEPVSPIELETMHSRLQAAPIVSSWEALDLMVGLSFNTLRAAGNFTDVSLLPIDLQTKVQRLQSLGVELRPSGIVVLTEPPPIKVKRSEILSTMSDPSLDATYKSILESREIWVWEYAGGRERIKHFCINQCACLAAKLSQVLPKDKTLILQVNGYGGMSVMTSRNLVLNFDYHVATAIHTEDIGWGVIDPIMYGDAKIHSISDWRSRIVNTKNIQIKVYPPATN